MGSSGVESIPAGGAAATAATASATAAATAATATATASATATATATATAADLTADCDLPPLEFRENILDKALLKIFRSFVKEFTGGISSDKEGISGLLEQGRQYYVSGATAEDNHRMVRRTLSSLMTPVLPPFYRLFMAGIVPR
jgi:hypothetical protein